MMIEIPNKQPLIEKLNKNDPLHRTVVFAGFMRGNSVVRILASHKESWWDSNLMNSGSTENCPISYPENLAGFCPVKLDQFKVWYDKPHTGSMIGDPFTFKKILLQRYRPVNKGKWWFTWSHVSNIPGTLTGNHIFLYASEKAKYRNYIDREKSKNKFAFNIDISKLFSYDRGEFYEEYTNIIQHFNFTPRYNSVRSFILQCLDREDYIEKFRNTK